MNKPLKYNFDGGFATEIEIIKAAYDRAKDYAPDERKAYLASISQVFSDHSMKNKFQTIYLPSAGVVFLIVILVVTYLTPFPTQFQSGAFWVILSLAAAACASVIPGFFEFKYQGIVKAGGAIGIFCLMYFYSPDIISKTSQGKETTISLYVVQEDSSAVQNLNPEFNPNSHELLATSVSKTINNYFGTNYPGSHYTYFRKTDGMIYSDQVCSDLRNYQLLIIPNTIIAHFSDKRQAYLKFNAMADKNK